MDETIDSRIATHQHIGDVQKLMIKVIGMLHQRLLDHDKTKLHPPEVELFDEFTPKLKGCTYLSPEYKEFLAQLKPALDHHYAHSPHHPEHYPDGIRGMSLIDLLEMICDWYCAARRHNDGNILVSIQKNQDRFKFSDELKQILINTAKLLES